jgi:hypothetical protein
MRFAFATTLTILALTGTTAAQPLASPEAATPPVSSEGEVSENAALVIALGGTVASYGMVYVAAQLEDSGARIGLLLGGAAGTLIAPSAGRWYAGSGGLRGLGLRLAGAGVAALAVPAAFSECSWSSGNSCEPVGAIVLGVAALGLYAAGTIDDIVMARRDARRHNARLHQVALIPIVRPDAQELGLAVAARF